MTSVQIGNYGVTGDDAESRGPQVAGFVMRESSPVASNWRADQTLREYLTRAQHRRDRRHRHARAHAEAAFGRRAARRDREPARASTRSSWWPRPPAIRPMEGSDLVKDVTCPAPYEWKSGDESDPDFLVPPERRASRRLRIAAYDLGIKFNILRRLAAHNCDVTVFPASAPAADLLAIEPDGIFLSNGPGDPAALPYVVDNARTLVDSDVPVFGICLGHQVLGLAMGGKTFKLKFGHRGGNHPVKNLATNKVEITSQNHGFAVDPDSLPGHVRVTHLNLYDGTVEGLRHVDKRVFCVQYHPEASPGPHDADYLFRQFLDEIEKK